MKHLGHARPHVFVLVMGGRAARATACFCICYGVGMRAFIPYLLIVRSVVCLFVCCACSFVRVFVWLFGYVCFVCVVSVFNQVVRVVVCLFIRSRVCLRVGWSGCGRVCLLVCCLCIVCVVLCLGCVFVWFVLVWVWCWFWYGLGCVGLFVCLLVCSCVCWFVLLCARSCVCQ